jgi:sialate O-acetylesterase
MKTPRTFLIALISILILSQNLSANVSLPEIFSDNMVLQQNTTVKIWGWSRPGEKVEISAGWLTTPVSITGSVQGRWSIAISTPVASGPYTLSVKGQNEIVFKNVMIGEVWVCSGQSNMEMSAEWGIKNGEEEIKNADHPEIRLFTVSTATALCPQDHFTGKWSVCTPETMKPFSAIGYFFARVISKELGVTVGIINSSWGGTPAESWMPEEAITSDAFLTEAASKQTPVPWGPVEIARIYNAMISPMTNYSIAGVLWYQGEANTINGYAYKNLLTALIGSWRNKWGYEFPFYYAQIAPYKYGKEFEGVIVRDQQRRTLDVPNTGMVVLSDLCDTTDIHPKDKLNAALRLADIALNRHYKKSVGTDSGPLYKSMIVDKNKAILTFDYSDGLHSTDKKITCFEVAGADKVFYPAEAKIKDNKIIVTSKSVKSPSFVRFAWRNTSIPNLVNGAGLPASCFTTVQQ